ncbi:hypothetical protein BOX15_Mlig024094g1 [Macrostomum lignano]|uniref:Uncharacterized protein n=1 Tax=Macrostomum lignano TaxID=282301 RepID=A0A267G8F7_9PLAT|nr:hypothetical protein BOX15_Mlig024094g1 [Macrostomum lignano]
MNSTGSWAPAAPSAACTPAWRPAEPPPTASTAARPTWPRSDSCPTVCWLCPRPLQMSGWPSPTSAAGRCRPGSSARSACCCSTTSTPTTAGTSGRRPLGRRRCGLAISDRCAGATGHLLCYGRSDPAALAAVEAAAGIGWQLLAAPGSAGRLLAKAPAPECRRFSTAPLMREISMKFEIKVGVLADCSAVPRRRLWELPDLRAVRQPAFADDDLGGGGSDGGKGGKEAEDSGGSDAWTAAARQLVEAAATPAGGKRPAGGGGLGRLLSCPEPPPQADSRWPAWESHLLHTEATYRMEGPDFAGSVGSFRLLDVGGSGRVAALVEFRVIETGIAGAAADAGEAGFDSAACAAAAKAEQQQQLSPASEELGSVCRVLRVRFPSFAGGGGSGGGSGGVRALRFLRLADLAEHLLLHCAQLLGCGLAIRVADDLVTQTLCQELGYRVASTRQPVSMGPNFDAVSNGCFSRAAGIGGSRSSASSRSSSVSSSGGGGGGGGGGGRGRGQAWEAATVSELHAQCRSSAAVLLVRSVPRLTSEEASSQ